MHSFFRAGIASVCYIQPLASAAPLTVAAVGLSANPAEHLAGQQVWFDCRIFRRRLTLALIHYLLNCVKYLTADYLRNAAINSYHVAAVYMVVSLAAGIRRSASSECVHPGVFLIAEYFVQRILCGLEVFG